MIRQRIIDESIKLFMLYGVKNTTMDDIAKHLGMSKRTIYTYFKDKNELLREGLHQEYESNMAENDKIVKESENILVAIIQILRQHKTEQNRKKVRVLLEVKRFYPEVYNDHMETCGRESVAKLQRAIERGIKQALFRPHINSQTTAFLFSEQVNYLLSEQLEKMDIAGSDQHEFSVFQVYEDLLINFLRGISTIRGIEIIDASW